MSERPKIYNRDVLHHYRHPHNRGELEDPDYRATEENSQCGDRITMELKLRGREINDVKFHGEGCVLSVGGASILTQMLRGRNIDTASEITLEDLVKNMGNPAKLRKECASLSLKAFKEILSRVRG